MSGVTAAGVKPVVQVSAEAWGWVRSAQGGDREAFGRLYARYEPEVFRFVRRRVRDCALAEDLTCETFVRAWRRIDTLRERRADPGAWLTTIARNLIADHVKSARYRLDLLVAEVPLPRAGLDAAGVEELVAARADRAAAARVVAECLAGLTADQRRALWLYEVGPQRGSVGVAAAMGRSPGAVKSLRHRALCAMRAHLAGLGLSSIEDCYDAGLRRPRPRPTQQPDSSAPGVVPGGCVPIGEAS